MMYVGDIDRELSKGGLPDWKSMHWVHIIGDTGRGISVRVYR